MPITKHSFLIRDKREIVKKVKEAFFIATTGRPGPVLVDLPKDIMAGEINESEIITNVNGFMKTYDSKYENSANLESLVKKAASMIEKAERPVIYAGGGITSSNSGAELLEFAERIEAPVTTTLMGITSFPAEHPLYLGMLGMHGTAYANKAVTGSDLLIALGARFEDRVTGKIKEFAPNAKIIHVDIDTAELGKNVNIDLGIKADVKQYLNKLSKTLPVKKHKEWVEK